MRTPIQAIADGFDFTPGVPRRDGSAPRIRRLTLMAGCEGGINLARRLMIQASDEALGQDLLHYCRLKNRLLGFLASLREPLSPLPMLLESEGTLLWNCAHFAQTDPSPEVRQAFEYLALDHLEHLHRLAECYEATGGKPERLIELPPCGGRPLAEQLLAPQDVLKAPIRPEPLSMAHLRTMRELEIRNHRLHLQAFESLADPRFRQDSAQCINVEEQHVAMLASFWGEGDGLHSLWNLQFALRALLAFFAHAEEDPAARRDFQRLLLVEEELWKA
ncbi:MAG: ferritin-like domain-containing protein, partial [Bacteroidota bacterium]